MQPLVDYPDTSPREFALGICANLRTQFGVDLAPILTSPALSERAKRRTAAQALAEAIIERAHRQQFPDFVNDPTEPADDGNIRRLLGSDRVADTIDTEPNFSVTERNAKILMTYEGDALKSYVFNLTKRFENMANATGVGVLVAEMAAGAVVAVGVPAGVATVKALRAGQALLAAMRTGVMSIGIKTVITAVAAVLIALLLYLVLENPKKILGFVFNNTDQNFVVNNWRDGGDLHMEHGEMADFMEDHSDGNLDSPMVQLKQRLYFGEGDEDNVVWCGVYFADRNFGFRGAEGVIVFTSSTAASNLKFAHMFAVPYTSDNGTNMRLVSGDGDLSKLYREMYDSRRVRVDFVDNGYRLTATVNDARGGVVACIASISNIAI